MKIAIVGFSAELREVMDGLLRKHLPSFTPLYFSAGVICRDALPMDTAAAFALVEDMEGVYDLAKLVRQYPALPVTVVSHSPDFALEAIRQSAKDYLIPPLAERDFMRALWRMNLPEEGGMALARAVIG